MGLSWKLSFILCIFFYIIQVLFLSFVNVFGLSSVLLTLTPAILYSLYCNFDFSKSILLPLTFFSFFDDLRLGVYLGTNLALILFIILFIKLYLEKNFSWSKHLVFIFALVIYYFLLYSLIAILINVFNFFNLLVVIIVNSLLNVIFLLVIQKFYKYLLVSKNEN
ncbi:hypothetical protein Thena_0682 [Thermodesulfobium narugense DSM 14796]|uniref:Rod shape-determining protein MreD n=1 Tax=Thermodesulfobium narugense DSM 14796 TaxID=747365 RepID=M1E4M8_9BACT|nr:hypothetical protein Thena_0682 [Thermodesulfobium narugense DSM 14796]